MLAKIIAVVSAASIASFVACAAPTGAESSDTNEKALVGGTDSVYPIVQVTNHITGLICSGTSLSDSWVLTTAACGSSPPNVLPSFQVCRRSPGVPQLDCVQATPQASNADAVLLKLDTPISFGSYPTISNSSAIAGVPLTCAGTSALTYQSTQATFEITNVTSRFFYATATGGLISEASDDGGGCFAGDALVGVMSSCNGGGCWVTQAAPLADFILANVGARPFCGSATCGVHQAGSQQVSCGTCTGGATCDVDRCVAPPRVCPRGTKDCGDGVCVPTRSYCQ